MGNSYEPSAGTLIYYALGTGVPATLLAGVDDINGLPTREADEFEITRVDQMDGAEHDWFKQFAPDHVDPGTLELTLGFSEDQLETLYGLIRDTTTWKILFPSGADVTFGGFIKSIGQQFEKNGEIKVPVTIRCSGKPVFTKAA